MDPDDGMLAAYIMHLSFLLKHSGKRMYGEVADLAPTEYPIMTMLVRGEQTIGQICSRLDRDKSHVSRDIAALVARGLVTKGRGATDGRQIVVRLSPDAAAVRDAMVRVIDQRTERLTAGLSAEEVAAFRRVLMAMIDNAQAMRTTP